MNNQILKTCDFVVGDYEGNVIPVILYFIYVINVCLIFNPNEKKCS